MTREIFIDSKPCLVHNFLHGSIGVLKEYELL